MQKSNTSALIGVELPLSSLWFEVKGLFFNTQVFVQGCRDDDCRPDSNSQRDCRYAVAVDGH
jgi:hypothetical protein